jgi:hypothetical protein
VTISGGDVFPERRFFQGKGISSYSFDNYNAHSKGVILHLVLLRASNEYGIVVRVSESCLRSLGMDYIRNSSESAVEFEITSPTYFRIVIEPNRVPEVDRLLFRSISSPKGATIEVRYESGADPPICESCKDYSRDFLRALVEALPEKPWTGIDGLLSHREEKKWKELLQY